MYNILIRIAISNTQDIINGDDNEQNVLVRRRFDPSQERGGMDHLTEGFQPADTPFLLRRQPQFKHQTQTNPSQYFNPQELNLRRGGYTQVNNVEQLMNIENFNPHLQQQLQLVNDIDSALLNDGELTEYLIERVNTKTTKLNRDDNLLVFEPLVNDFQKLEIQPLDPSDDDDSDNDNENMNDISINDHVITPSNNNIEIENDKKEEKENNLFNEKQIEQKNDIEEQINTIPSANINIVELDVVSTPVIAEAESNNKEPEKVDNKDGDSLQHFVNRLAAIAALNGLSKQTFQKWSGFKPVLTAEQLGKILRDAGLIITNDETQEVINLVVKEPGSPLTLSTFVRLLGRAND